MQARRIEEQREGGRGREERCGLQRHVTEDVAFWPRGRMVMNSANGPGGCLLTEMLQVLLMERVCEIAHRFDKRFQRRMSCPRHGKFFDWCSGRSWDAKPEEGLRNFRTIALMSVLAMRSSSVVANMLTEETDPMEWSVECGIRKLCELRAPGSVGDQFVAGALRIARRREGPGALGKGTYRTAFTTSLDVGF